MRRSARSQALSYALKRKGDKDLDGKSRKYAAPSQSIPPSAPAAILRADDPVEAEPSAAPALLESPRLCALAGPRQRLLRRRGAERLPDGVGNGDQPGAIGGVVSALRPRKEINSFQCLAHGGSAKPLASEVSAGSVGTLSPQENDRSVPISVCLTRAAARGRPGRCSWGQAGRHLATQRL